MSERQRILKSKILVVEGKNDKNFFKAFLDYLELKDIQIFEIKGNTKYRKRLEGITILDNFDKVISIGLVRDANSNPQTTFQSIRDALKTLNLSVPKKPLEPVGNNPRINVLILPEENTPGMLEDLCLRSVEADPAIPCLDQYFKCLEDKELQSSNNRSKARVQAFLASRPKAGISLGVAAKAGYWPFDDIAFELVKSFLIQI